MAEDVTQALNDLFDKRVAFHMSEGLDDANARRAASLDVYGGDLRVGGRPDPDTDTRILEARKIAGDA